MTVQSTKDQGGRAVQSDDQGGQTEDQVRNEQSEVKVAGKTYTSLEDLKKDYESLQKEFTKKTQEAKETSEQLPEESEELKQLKGTLKSLGFTTKEDVENFTVKAKEEAKIQAVLAHNPDLSDKEEEIKDLMNLPKNQGKSIEEVIIQYGLKSDDKLKRAKTREVMGEPRTPSKGEELSVSQMDPLSPEYEEWRSKNIPRTSWAN